MINSITGDSGNEKYTFFITPTIQKLHNLIFVSREWYLNSHSLRFLFVFFFLFTSTRDHMRYLHMNQKLKNVYRNQIDLYGFLIQGNHVYRMRIFFHWFCFCGSVAISIIYIPVLSLSFSNLVFEMSLFSYFSNKHWLNEI